MITPIARLELLYIIIAGQSKEFLTILNRDSGTATIIDERFE